MTSWRYFGLSFLFSCAQPDSKVLVFWRKVLEQKLDPHFVTFLCDSFDFFQMEPNPIWQMWQPSVYLYNPTGLWCCCPGTPTATGFKIYRRKFTVTPTPHEVPKSSNATFGEGTFGLRPDRAPQPLLPENQAGCAGARRQRSEPACRWLKAEANLPGCLHFLSVPSEPRLWGSLREPPC